MLRALALRLAPPVVKLDPSSWEEFYAIIARTFSELPARVRWQVRLFLFVLRWMTLPLHGGLFDLLAPKDQDEVLHWLEDHPWRLLRIAFWGVRALIFTGYYGNPGLWHKMGYAPVPEGNRMLRG